MRHEQTLVPFYLFLKQKRTDKEFACDAQYELTLHKDSNWRIMEKKRSCISQYIVIRTLRSYIKLFTSTEKRL